MINTLLGFYYYIKILLTDYSSLRPVRLPGKSHLGGGEAPGN